MNFDRIKMPDQPKNLFDISEESESVLSSKSVMGETAPLPEKGMNIEQVMSSLMDGVVQVTENPEQNGAEKRTDPDTGRTEFVFKPDPITAEFTAVVWIEFFGGIIDGIGSAITKNDEKKYGPKGKFMSTYEKITKSALESGEVKLPSPMQMFIIGTIGILLLSAVDIFKDYKKEKKKRAASEARLKAAADETRPIETIKVTETVRADISQEALRGRFNVDEKGFYTYSQKGEYFKINERHIKPSVFAEQLIKQGKSNSEIKEAINNHIKQSVKNG